VFLELFMSAHIKMEGQRWESKEARNLQKINTAVGIVVNYR
jgi:hypothetical protein